MPSGSMKLNDRACVPQSSPQSSFRHMHRNPHFAILILNVQWNPQDGDREAAWAFIYIELLTRITTQPLANEEEIEQAALDSVY